MLPGSGRLCASSDKWVASQQQNREDLGRRPLVPAEEESDEGKVPPKLFTLSQLGQARRGPPKLFRFWGLGLLAVGCEGVRFRSESMGEEVSSSDSYIPLLEQAKWPASECPGTCRRPDRWQPCAHPALSAQEAHKNQNPKSEALFASGLVTSAIEGNPKPYTPNSEPRVLHLEPRAPHPEPKKLSPRAPKVCLDRQP